MRCYDVRARRSVIDRDVENVSAQRRTERTTSHREQCYARLAITAYDRTSYLQ